MLPFATQKVQYIKDPDKPFTTPQLRKDLRKIWIDKMVTKIKEGAKENSMWLAPILIGLLFSYNVYSSHQADTKQLELSIALIQIQKDLLILQTQKQDEDRRNAENRQREDQNKEVDRVWRENINKGFNRLELIVQGRYPQQNNHAQAPQ